MASLALAAGPCAGLPSKRRPRGRLLAAIAATAAAGLASLAVLRACRAACGFAAGGLPEQRPRTATGRSAVAPAAATARGEVKKRPARPRLGFNQPKVSDAPPAGYDEGPKELGIVRYPHPALRRPNALVTEFDGRLRQLAENLLAAMYKENDPPGVGLAAPQVGVNVRMMVFNALRTAERRNRQGEKVFINPQIVAKSDELCEMFEACLSFPKMEGPVVRPTWVEVEAFDLDGSPQRERFEGDEARVFQHEYDHLDGVVYVDHLEEEDRRRVQVKLDRLLAEYEAGGGKQPLP